MLKKLTITFLFMTFFTIITVCSTSQGQPPDLRIYEIVPDEFEEILPFTGPDKITRVAKIKRKGLELQLWINGVRQEKIHTTKYEDFKFCTKVDRGDSEAIQIPPNSGIYFVCHSLIDARDRSFLIGNHVKCPYFVPSLGIIVELCPHSH
jgi:hypothetical protein